MASKKQPDALIGKHVRVRADLRSVLNDKPHAFGGLVGQVLTRNEAGSYQVAFGEYMQVLQMEDFTVEEAGAPSAFVDVAPQLAINSLTNPRRRKGLDIDSLNALAASIKAQGLGQAILVRPLPASRLEDTAGMDPRPIYEVIAGERRWRACQIAGLGTMPMLVRDMTDAAVLEMQLVENVEREDLDDMEEAEGFERLRRDLGYTVEQIAQRIAHGKGESYVYKALRLCELTPQSREAMYEGANGAPAILGRSTGLLVARYKPEQQQEVIEFIASQAGADGEPMPFRQIAPKVFKRFNLALASAPFDIKADALVAECPACTSCPKRSGAQADIFGDGGADDSCTDPVCFDGKREAHIVLVRKKAQKDGFKVIDGDEARSAKPSPFTKVISGYVRLTDVAETEKGNDGVERDVTFEDKLRSLGKKAPKPRIFIDPHTGAAVQVITADLAEKLVPPAEEPPKKAGKKAKPAAYAYDPDGQHDGDEEEDALSDWRIERAVTVRIFDAIRTRERTLDDAKLLLKAIFRLAEAGEEGTLPRLEAYLGWQSDLDGREGPEALGIISAKVDAMLPEQIGQALVMAAVEATINDFDLTRAQHLELARAYGIDVLAVRDKVAEDLEKQKADPLAGEEPGESQEGAAA